MDVTVPVKEARRQVLRRPLTSGYVLAIGLAALVCRLWEAIA